MGRITVALDRIATLIAGLVLLAGGLALVGWKTRWPPSWTHRLGDHVSTIPLSNALADSWWQWCGGIGAAVLGLLVLRWMLAHVPVPHAFPITLPGSDETGSLTVDARIAADAAADALAATSLLDHAAAAVRRDRGDTIIDITARTHPDIPLSAAITAAQPAADQLHAFLGDGSPHVRLHLHVVRRPARSRHLH